MFGRFVDMQGLAVAQQRLHPVPLSPWGVGVWGAKCPQRLGIPDQVQSRTLPEPLPELIQNSFRAYPFEFKR